ncbi:hypothetical protein CDD82_6324 [Ophiocordyceps australis]|uniref:Beige protein homolog 1 n=1 Tax=Ophiocordyceps australis TaxID=1399860 RepID=A0A2C5YWD4_9HYPO|nr:hypothetical protein CDD82_6324 [Ophiocordyceps australis]
MDSVPRRHRSTTLTPSPRPPGSGSLLVVGDLLKGLAAIAAAPQGPDSEKLLVGLRRVSDHIEASTPAHQDDFRHVHGFDAVLSLLRAYSGYYDPQKRSETELLSLFQVLGACLHVLAAALRDHSGNRRFFRYRVQAGGWEALEQVLASIGLGGAEPDPWASCHIFGKLLSFALDDQGLDLLCQSVAKAMRPDSASASGNGADDEEWDFVLTRSVQSIGSSIREIVNGKTIIRFPEILRPLVSFWMAIARPPGWPAGPNSILVLETILCAISVSMYNRAAAHSTGILSQLLRLAFSPDSWLAEPERAKVLAICKLLMSLGVNQPADTQFLLCAPQADAAEFCLDIMSEYSGPSFFHFDLSLHGYSSIELPSLGRSFPPLSSAGYTFTAWVRVEAFDPAVHTTLFGVFDASQTCFVLMYLERDTHNFILQTSVFSNKPSVRFRSVVFREKQWYHIAVVHRRPRALTNSKASLYVNGDFAEQVRCSYPHAPPLLNNNSESFASFNSTQNRTSPVQAFLGTPRELSGQTGPGVVASKWSLASAHLFEDVLSDDFLAVHHGLGPRYQGNFQDCLGGFQTYEASALLGLRNEIVHPDKDEKSDILKAVRDKASTLLPESKVLLGILPSATFAENVQYLDTGLLRSLPRASARNLFQLASRDGAPLAVNCAVPNLADALSRSHGIASMRGSPVISMPSYLDEQVWRLAGFTPLALKLLARAANVEETVRSLEIMFQCIRKSWRNSEAIERDNGYGVLGMILRIKIGQWNNTSAGEMPIVRLNLSRDERDSLGFQVLSLILGFLGYNHETPIESSIVNPLAYRILLIDLDIWRRCAPRIQALYYKQFVTFAVNSKHHEFNRRRLIRMRIVKRLLDAYKGESLPESVMEPFTQAFDALIRSSLSQEVLRVLSLFITYSFHTPSQSPSRSCNQSARTSTAGIIKRPGGEETGRLRSSSIGLKLLSRKELGKQVLSIYSHILCEKSTTNSVKKFSRSVTNRWLLSLVSDQDATIAFHGCKIKSRLLSIQGSSFASRLSGKTGDSVVMANRLKRFWDIPALWVVCLSILFGRDMTDIDFTAGFDVATLLDLFGKRKVANADFIIVITSMLQHGMKQIVQHQEDPSSPVGANVMPQATLGPDFGNRPLSMDLARTLKHRSAFSQDRERVMSNSKMLQTVVEFFKELQERSPEFRDFALSSDWVRLLLFALYPLIVSTDAVAPDVELNSRHSALTFEGSDVIIRPIGGCATVPIVRASNVDLMPSPQSTPPKGTPLKRASSFVLLTTHTATNLQASTSLSDGKPSSGSGAQISEAVLDLVLGVFMDQVFVRRDFSGFGLFTKVPPGFQEHQAYFESLILKKVVTRVSDKMHTSQKAICEPRILTNLSRLCLHLSEAIFEGWFIDGAEVVIDLCGMLLEILHRPDVAKMKSVRLCSQALATIRSCFLRIILLRLSDLDKAGLAEKDANVFMNKLAYWQMSILECVTLDEAYLKLLWYQLYTKLIDGRRSMRTAAANFLRIILMQKPEQSAAMIDSCMTPDQKSLSQNFQKLTEVDDETFVAWVDQHRSSLDQLFLGSMAKAWEDFVNLENHETFETAKTRLSRRRDRLRAWHSEAASNENILVNHEIGNKAWTKSVYNAEFFKHQRLAQDLQDDIAFLLATYSRMERDLKRPGAVFHEPAVLKWKLDRTEGRNRMRLRLLPDFSAMDKNYQPKKKGGSDADGTAVRPEEALAPVAALSLKSGEQSTSIDGASSVDEAEAAPTLEQEAWCAPDDDFELVDDLNDPGEGDETFEDKNRKVMRRLQRGDQVQAAYNMSRVTGLEACEGLLIVGKDALYMVDNVFQCVNGDIINVWQAPPEERDPFTMVVTGAKTLEKRQNLGTRDQESRHWRWQDVISISKRRFLFRDVAIEVFFTDGQSYLLTTINPAVRDELFVKMLAKAPHTSTAHALPNPEDAWRLEALKASDEATSLQGFGAGLGSRLGTLFNSSPWASIAKRWQRGEVSNFHYLMMVNTMAGRTFNDLTQYPVFPWILADYTSEHLDLEDPATFRDLSKPMGAQTGERVRGFVETYKALSEIGQTPFHYGTHYSSAMIVSSYLIRLPPFVQSYLMVQGDSFDHADRLFQSVGDAWKSASQNNKTDVRELIPEFFCLAEFLNNINGYDFGRRQSNGARVDNVALPPWAKGDAKIFIAKHREALESPYVSERLHGWIDLVFGCKQRGEAAIDSLNVFHHLSYAGASDLDSITDANERAITAGVIHNFGQTPHQVFMRPHPPRENVKCPTRRLDTAVFALTCSGQPLLETHERVTSLVYASKLDRLLCASPLRLNFSPFDKYLEWGYADNSIRFFHSDNRKLAGLFENLHTGQLSCACFADSKTLITAGQDCVVSVHTLHTGPGRGVDLTPRASVFGHKAPVTSIAVSKALSTFVTASTDGQAFLWDLNQVSFIRRLPLVRPVECARINDVSGDVLLGCGPNVVLYTLNGSLILDQNVCDDEGDWVHSCAFYEGAGDEWLENQLIFTGHAKGRVCVWRKSVVGGRWMLELQRCLEHVEVRSAAGGNIEAGITCIAPMPLCLYTGSEDGSVYEWRFARGDR